MRTISTSIAASLLVVAATAIGASVASATITPTTGTFTAVKTTTVTFASQLLNNTCETLDFHGDINMDNPAGQGGGGIITGWTFSGCLINPTAHFVPPWTFNIDNHVSGSTWSGSLTGITFTMSFCHYRGSLPLDYDNSTGRLSITGGTLDGGICGPTTMSGVWDLRVGAAIPVVS